MKKIIVLSLTLILVLGGCKKSTDNPDLGARDALYQLMTSWYLWYDKVPAVNKDDYSNPYDLLEAMRYKTLDKWSFVADYDEFLSEMSGGFVGHGIRIGLDNDNNARIASIYNGSDLYTKGVRRGWIIETINGTALAPIMVAGDAAAYNSLLGPSTEGTTNTFLFKKPDGTEVTLTGTKMSFTVNTVLAADTLHLTSGITGYLSFDAFYSSSKAELDTAFAHFTKYGCTDLIVDLRYNTGGYVDIAQLLASYIAGSTNTGKTFINYKYNNLAGPTNDHSDNFITTLYPMDLSRVVFITSGSTASASEVVITSLMPYKTVKLVGSNTYGKPCGMDVFQYDYKYIIAPITFEYTNSDNFGQFYTGLPVDVAAEDDITHDFGDRNEECLAAAINYLEGGTLKSKSVNGSVRQPGIFLEGKRRTDNLFINNVQGAGL